jgi:RHH-type rel operon transcriptional repressor/antitoxin RelB
MTGAQEEAAMGAQIPRSFTVSAEQAARLERLALETRRSPEAILGDALENHLDLEEWQIARIRKGLEEARRGETVPHEAVDKWLASWGTENELDPPL